MTRIKYLKSGKNYTSQYLNNYEGNKFIVFIHKLDKNYTLSIVDQKNDVVFREEFTSAPEAKRKARKVLINDLNINLNEEIRIRG